MIPSEGPGYKELLAEPANTHRLPKGAFVVFLRRSLHSRLHWQDNRLIEFCLELPWRQPHRAAQVSVDLSKFGVRLTPRP